MLCVRSFISLEALCLRKGAKFTDLTLLATTPMPMLESLVFDVPNYVLKDILVSEQYSNT